MPARAERALRPAVRSNPSDPHAWHHLANHLHAMGRMEERVDARARSVALDPLNARTRIVLASDYRRIGRLDEARRQYERARTLDPMNPLLLGLGPALPTAALVFLPLERPDSAVQELLRAAALRGATAGELDAMRGAFAESGMPGFWRRWLEMDLRQSGRNIDPPRVATLWASIGDADRAVAWLERAYDERNPGLIYLASEPNFRALRAHPRVARILRAMRLPAG